MEATDTLRRFAAFCTFRRYSVSCIPEGIVGWCFLMPTGFSYWRKHWAIVLLNPRLA